jgi:hypothetical protein
MPKPNKQQIIDVIVKGIALGKERGVMLSTIVKKWQLSARTFDRYWKVANEQHSTKQAKLKNQLEEVERQAAVDALKKEILSVEERKIILSKIATGTLRLKRWWIGKDYEISKDVVPDYMDRKNAIAELNKMEGSYAPSKVAATDTEGNDVKRQIIVIGGKELEF